MKFQQRVESAADSVRTQAAATGTKLKEAAEPFGKALLQQARQFLAFVIAFGVVLVIFWGWAEIQSVGDSRPKLFLVGQLAFFGAVVWWGIATASQLINWVSRRWIPAISPVQALVWAAVVVLGVPVATHHRFEGVAVFLGCFLLFAAVFFVLDRKNVFRRIPLTASAGLAAVALFATVAFFGPITVIEDSTLSTIPPVEGADDLARTLRPMLFFDSDERYEPVDLAGAEVMGCTEKLKGQPCDPADLAALDDWDYLKITATKLGAKERPGGDDSAIYYHANQDGDWLYLDYWWYFAHNPSPQGGDVLCADVFGWTSDACQEHSSDWEGMTLALIKRGCDTNLDAFSCVSLGEIRYEIVRADYAQHNKVVSYPWETLQIEWQRDTMLTFSRNAGARPLVFPALLGHASYAMPCPKGCHQIVEPKLSERRNGGKEWLNNADSVCDSRCVQRLPLDDEGNPATWNAFPGRWGPSTCILFGSYCDLQPAPRAPAFQRRYDHPCPADHCFRSATY